MISNEYPIPMDLPSAPYTTPTELASFYAQKDLSKPSLEEVKFIRDRLRKLILRIQPCIAEELEIEDRVRFASSWLKEKCDKATKEMRIRNYLMLKKEQEDIKFKLGYLLWQKVNMLKNAPFGFTYQFTVYDEIFF